MLISENFQYMFSNLYSSVSEFELKGEINIDYLVNIK